jgi:hypothetical protein
VHDHHRVLDHRPRGDVHDERVHGERLVEEEEVAGVGDDRPEEMLALGVLGGPAEAQQLVPHRRGQGGQDAVDGDHQS